MALETCFNPIELSALSEKVKARKAEGWRFVQLLAVNTDEGIDLIYSFMKDNVLENDEVKGLTNTDIVPSITDEYLEAFVFENEVHDLFDIQIKGIAIDFGGHFYKLHEKAPMTVISPEQKAAKEKAAKIAAAKKAKEAKEKAAGDAGAADEGAHGKADAQGESGAKAEAEDKQDDLEAKLAGMDPEKAAKVRAAMEARAKKAKGE